MALFLADIENKFFSEVLLITQQLIQLVPVQSRNLIFLNPLAYSQWLVARREYLEGTGILQRRISAVKQRRIVTRRPIEIFRPFSQSLSWLLIADQRA